MKSKDIVNLIKDVTDKFSSFKDNSGPQQDLLGLATTIIDRLNMNQ